MILLILTVISYANVGVLTKNTTNMPSEQVAKDSFGRDTPRSTIQGFVQALTDKDNKLAYEYLDNSFTKSNKNPEMVIGSLKIALDKGGRLEPLLNISDKPDGDLADKLPSNQEKVGTIRIHQQEIDLLLIKKTNKDNSHYWQISQETLKKIPLTKELPSSNTVLPVEFLQGKSILGHDMADIAVLLLLLVAGLLVVWLCVLFVYSVSAFVYPKLTKKQFGIPQKAILPLAVVILAYILPELMVQAGVPVTLRSAVIRAKDVVAWLAMAWLVLRLLDAVFKRAEAASLRRSRPEQVSILNLLRKVAKAFMLILALIIILGNLGFDLTTGIAALGVGGLALAFGAQKTIENLIGSVVVVADRPVHVGDYCRFGDMEGTVIDIGIRSSRIRTLNRTIVTVPNGEFSAMQIENYTARDMFHFLHNLYLKRNICPMVLDEVIKALKEFLLTHRYTNQEWTQVRISEIRQDCFVVEMRCYIVAEQVREFYDRQTVLIIEILQKLNEYPVEHALPSQEIHIAGTD